jgi:DNA-3-methyladenine glycosylase II
MIRTEINLWKETISFTGPYDFDRVLDRLSLDPINVVHLQQRIVKVPLVMEEKAIVVKVQATGTTEQPEFLIQGSDLEEQAIEKIKKIFQWNVSLDTIHQHFQGTNLKGLFSEHHGTPLVLDFNPYGCLLKCIVHQQLNRFCSYTFKTIH